MMGSIKNENDAIFEVFCKRTFLCTDKCVLYTYNPFLPMLEIVCMHVPRSCKMYFRTKSNILPLSLSVQHVRLETTTGLVR